MSENEPKEKAVEATARKEATPVSSEKLERIFREHHALVFRSAYRITGNATDAEDVLQTVFLRLLRLERGEGLSESSPGSYLHRAAVNAALDLVRNRRTWRATPLEEVVIPLEDPQPRPEQLREGREIRARIRESLAGLSPKMAEIFALRYFEGYDNHEIARMLRTSRSTVAVLLHRARHRLKKDIHSFLGESS